MERINHWSCDVRDNCVTGLSDVITRLDIIEDTLIKITGSFKQL